MSTVVTRHQVNTNRREGERTQTLHWDTQTQSQKVIGLEDKKRRRKIQTNTKRKQDKKTEEEKQKPEDTSHTDVAPGYSDTKPKSNRIGRQKE